MKNKITLLMLFWGITVLVWSPYSYADAGHHGTHRYYHYHDHPHFGLRVSSFYPDEYYSFWSGGSRYYYDDGVYYDYVGGNYVVAAPPVGAVISTIPADFQPVSINGVTYYTDNGAYYLHTPNGYEVVSQPVGSAPVMAVNSQNVVTVNVPNTKGGYVAVTLRRSGNGFVGPQGEFYQGFPNVSQLQMIYGK